MRPLILPAFLALFSLPVLAAAPWQARPLAEIAVYPERSAQAQVVSLNESRLAAEIAAPLARLPVEPGQTLKKGAVVAELACRDYDLAVERAAAGLRAGEAQARLATLQRQRAEKLAAEGFLSQEALDGREAELDAARAGVAVNVVALKTARADQGKCVLRAPFPAIVQERLGQVGEMLAPGTPVVTLLDTSRIEVRAEVQADDRESLGQAGKIAFSSQGRRHGLRLKRLSPTVQRTTRMVEARLVFKGTAAPPGASGRAIWQDHRPHVPADYLVRRQGGLGVFVVDTAGQPRFTPLPAAQEGRPAALDLPPATRVIVRGQNAL